MIICTVTTKNNMYLPMVLANSVKEHLPDAKVAVCFVEKEIPSEAKKFMNFDYLLLSKDLGFPNFNKHIFKHNAVEACTSVKARLFLHLLNRYPTEDRFIFLDGDVKVFGPFEEVNQALNVHPIVVTPHILHPEETVDNVINYEIFLNKFGIYNMGFLAIKRSDMAFQFLKWWADRLEMFCYIAGERGIFTDQKWMDYAPVFYNAYILQHPGYNVASWNIHHRSIDLSPLGQYTINGKPLRFFHFSGLFRVKDENSFKKLHNKHLGNPTFLNRILDQYLLEVKATGADLSRELPWSYEVFDSGEPIQMETRIGYRDNLDLFSHIEDPFQFSNRTFHVNSSSRASGKNEPLVFCTVLTKKYINAAIIMAKSIKAHHPQVKIAACFVEEKMPVDTHLLRDFDHLVLAKDLDIPNFYQQIFMHDEDEVCTFLKTSFLLYLFKNYQQWDRFVYIDPEAMVFSSIDEFLKKLDLNSIVLVPHFLHPEHNFHHIKDTEISLSQSGLYSFSFFGVKRSASSKLFLHWMSKRLIEFYDVPESYRFDKGAKWLDYAPSYFDVYLFRHAGYNVTPGNIFHRKIKYSDGKYTVNGSPLRLFHFANIHRQKRKDYLSLLERHPGEERVIKQLIQEYKTRLNQVESHKPDKDTWSYSYFLNGEPIELASRINYRNHDYKFKKIKNPFNESNKTFRLPLT